MFNKSIKLKKKETEVQKERKLFKETGGHGDMNAWDRGNLLYIESAAEKTNHLLQPCIAMKWFQMVPFGQ